MKAILTLWLLVAGASYAAPLIDEPVAELRLKSGKTYRDATARSYSPTTVFIRHAEGAASIRYEDFPDTLSAALAARRPPAPPASANATPPPNPAPSQPGRAQGPTMPLNRAEIGLAVNRIRGNLADVELHNFGARAYGLGPFSIIGITTDGRRIAGAAWVGVDASDRVAVVMKKEQAITPGCPRTITVRFELPEGAQLASLEWAYPK